MTFQSSLLAATALCALTLAPAAPADELFPLPEGPLIVGAPSHSSVGESFADLLRRFSALTEIGITARAETMAQLEATRLDLIGAVSVPPEEVYSFVESLLLQNDFVVTLLRESEPRLLAVHSVYSSSERNVGLKARLMPIELVEALEDHPALMIRTVVDVSPADASLVARALLDSVRNQHGFWVWGTGSRASLVIAGPAGWVRETAALAKLVASNQAALDQRLAEAAPEVEVGADLGQE